MKIKIQKSVVRHLTLEYRRCKRVRRIITKIIGDY